MGDPALTLPILKTPPSGHRLATVSASAANVADSFEVSKAPDPTLASMRALAAAARATAPPPPTGAAPQTPLTSVLRQNFARWSQGKNEITPADVYRELSNPQNTGDSAVAVAFLASWEDGINQTQPFTMQDITGYEQAKASGQATGDLDWDDYFNSLKGNLTAEAPEKLWAGDKPALTDLAQGWLGDCFDISAFGAQIVNNPDAVAKMVKPDPQGGYTVTFPGYSEPQHVDLTQAEMAYFGSGRPKGLMQLLLEKAAGQIQIDRARADGDTQNYGDAFYALTKIPGYPSNGVTLITGHQAVTCSLQATGTNGQPPTPDQTNGTLNNMRTDLSNYVGKGGIVTATSADAFFGERHACAVLNYDPKSDVVTLWNPWGVAPPEQDTTPGQDGTFTMTMANFQKHFVQITFEQPQTAASIDSTPFTDPQAPPPPAASALPIAPAAGQAPAASQAAPPSPAPVPATV